MEIKKRIVSKSHKNIRPGYSMKPQYITVHNTANTKKGANAKVHARYLATGAGGRIVGWHYTVDDKEIYQHIPTNESSWHAGDGGNGTGNRKSIGIEICENEGADFEQAVKNAQWLIRHLMKEHNIPLSHVVPHKQWSGKLCPRKLLDRWDSFKDGLKEVEVAKVKKPRDEVYRSFLDSYDWVVKEGLSDGSKPKDPITREQFFEVLYRYHNKYSK